MAAAIVLAAGAGERMGGDRPKCLMKVGKSTILALATRSAAACPEVEALVITAPPGFEARIATLLAAELDVPFEVIPGGTTRQESVRLALEEVPDPTETVAVHDAARCLASPDLFSRVLAALSEADGVVPTVPVPDTVKRIDSGRIVQTIPREEFGFAQTPQAFRLAALRRAHERAASEGRDFTDDASLLEWDGARVVAIPGEEGNLKITTPSDISRAEAIRKECAGG